MKSWISWFEIPTEDLPRAVTFYEKLFSVKLKSMEFGPAKMAFFPKENPQEGVGGALVKEADAQPGRTGTLVYLNGGDNLSTYLNKVADCGGKVLQEKTLISEDIGYFGIFLDSEGNRIAIYSPN